MTWNWHRIQYTCT